MKPYRFIIIVFLLLFIGLGTFGCSKNLSDDEKFYKENAGQLYKILKGYFSIKIRSEKKKVPGKEYTELIIYEPNDIKKRERFFEENREKWLELDHNLKTFPAKFPKSIWRDDAAFFRVFECIIAKFPKEYWSVHGVEAMSYFLDNYKTFNIENWTKSIFEDIYYPIFLIEKNDSVSTENEKIKGSIYILLIVQHCLNKDFNKAEETLLNLKTEGIESSDYVDTGKLIIQEYRKMAHNKANSADTKSRAAD